MPGIGRLKDRSFIRAFQVIDGVIQDNQPVFLFVWVGSVVALVIAAAIGINQIDGMNRAILIGALIVYLLGVQIGNPEQSIQRVAMRASQGGHDVPDEKLRARFKRTQANLKRAIERLPYVIVYSNDDLNHPYRLVDLYENGKNI